MAFKSNSQIRWNNAVPEPSMYSVYFSGEMAGDRASSRRSSCLRSSNRSVRKSFPSQVNRSNAKKHGAFPRRNSRFLKCGLPRLSREQISPSMTALAFGSESEIDSANAEKEANGSRCVRATEHRHARLRRVLGSHRISTRRSTQDHQRERPVSTAAWD